MGAFCRVGLSGDYYLPSLQRAHRPRWTTLSASEPGAGDKLGARLRHSPRVCLVLHELALGEVHGAKLILASAGIKRKRKLEKGHRGLLNGSSGFEYMRSDGEFVTSCWLWNVI